jgi:DNA repair and recombination RAD54-like protein
VRLTKPLYDPGRPGALVLYKPPASKKTDIGVILDPRLGVKLRPHQKEGVSFMFDCVSGKNGHTGCILADEM